MSIDIPKNMKLKMKYGKLDNHINYVVIKDIDATVANVGIGLKVGSIYDPIDNMGMAHFLEHMLFLGSKKYKDESYFDTMVKQYGGFSNAYTTSFETVYYFNVLSEHLDQILDIFSRFFIDPLFDINSVSREINAINSEHMKNLNSDFWIIRQLICDISNNDSMIHRFTTGSHETFYKDYKKLRNKMIDFYNKYYCTDNLYIVIQSNMDLDKMEKLIFKQFNDIEYKKSVSYNLELYPKFSIKNKEYQIIPSHDNEYIVYFWDLPSIHNYNDNKIIDMIIHIIMIRCENNLYNILTQTLSIISIEPYYIEDGVFTLKVNMIKNSKTIENINKINNIVASYFNNLSNFNWDKLYNQMEIVYRFIYDNSEKQANSDIMMDIITNMMYYKVANIYNGDKLIIYKDYKMLHNTIKLLKFKNVSIIYGTNINIDKGEFLKEPYYNKKYKPLKYGLIRNLKNINYNFNVIIDMDVYNINPNIIKGLNMMVPVKLNDSVWYIGVSKFNEPFGRVDIILRNDIIFNNIISSITSNIAINIINYYISIIFCQYFNVNYNVAVIKNNNNCYISMIISGYNDKFCDFVKMVLAKIKTINPSENIIILYKNKYKEMLDNKKTQTPWAYANMIMDYIYPYNYNYIEQLKILSKIDNKMIETMINMIIQLKQFNITTLWSGNILKPDDLLIKTNTHINYVKMTPRPIKDIIIKHPNKNEKNKCIMISLQCTYYDKVTFLPRDDAIIMILSAILHQPVYGELRTKHQLGYMVGSYCYYDTINTYIIIKIQTDKDINIVKKIIYKFIESFKEIILNYDLDKFNKIKKSVYDKLIEPYTTMDELNSIILSEIKKEQYIFDRRNRIAKEIKNIKLNDIIKLYHSIILKKNTLIISS